MNRDSVSPLSWLGSGLLWRTFFLLAFLITASLITWIAGFRAIEREPRAQQVAAQVISIVTITRAALTHSAADLRRELLFDLASNEGIRIFPLEDTDVITPPARGGIMEIVEQDVKARLGTRTRFASSVNDVAGFWVSFDIDDDDYWLRLDRDRIERWSNAQWIGLAGTTLLLSLLGAIFISRLINQPLARITAATRKIAKGQSPNPLPESGPTEIREANRSFNQMIDDLERVESDRAVILAGISHDLRTPLARMQLEVELAHLSDDAREGMQSDLAQMDAIIGQFLEYAKPANQANLASVDLSALLHDCTHEAERMSDVRMTSDIETDIHVFANETEIKRIVSNLIQNARRYGKTEGTDEADIHIACAKRDGHAIFSVSDQGQGVPEEEIERMLRPFTRIDAARSQANGAGLGLAIVDRIVERHRGKLLIRNGAKGLQVQITLPITGAL